MSPTIPVIIKLIETPLINRVCFVNLSSINFHCDVLKNVEIINTNNGLVLSTADTKEIGPRSLASSPNMIAIIGRTPSPNIISKRVFFLRSDRKRLFHTLGSANAVNTKTTPSCWSGNTSHMSRYPRAYFAEKNPVPRPIELINNTGILRDGKNSRWSTNFLREIKIVPIITMTIEIHCTTLRVSSKKIIASIATAIGSVCVIAIARVASSDLRPINIAANPIPIEMPDANAIIKDSVGTCLGIPANNIMGRQ